MTFITNCELQGKEIISVVLDSQQLPSLLALLYSGGRWGSTVPDEREFHAAHSGAGPWREGPGSVSQDEPG